MTEEQFERLNNSIKEQIAYSINLNVNGKVDALNEIMVKHMEDDRIVAEKLVLHLASEEEWKKQAQPIIELGRNISGFGKVVAYILGVMGGITVVALSIWKGITMWKGV